MERSRECPAKEEPLTYTAEDLSRLMHCTIQHIRNMDGKGIIPGRIKFGKLVRFSKRLVDDWVNTCQRIQTNLTQSLPQGKKGGGK